MGLRLTTSHWSLATAFFLQRRNRLVIDIPLLQYPKDNTAGEAGAHQGAESAGRLLLPVGLRYSLAPQKLARQLFLVDLAVSRWNHLLDDVRVYSLDLQVLDHAQPPELFVLLAKARVALRVTGVVKIFLRLQPGDHRFDHRVAVILFRNAIAHQ